MAADQAGEGADWVFLRGWGVMTPVAIKTAARVGFPVDHIIGDIWSGSEDDVRPAGAAAKGYLAVSAVPARHELPRSLKKLKTAIIDAGKSDLKDPTKFGTVYYNFGVIEGIIAVEASAPARRSSATVRSTTKKGSGRSSISTSRRAHRRARGEGPDLPAKVTWTDHEGGVPRPRSSNGPARRGSR